MGTTFFRTSDLAKELGVHVNTIRLYEASGFLAPIPRGTNGYRQYSALHLEQAPAHSVGETCSKWRSGHGGRLLPLKLST
jgi:MerR family regulatory protein